MQTLSASDLAIATAIQVDSLTVVEKPSRLGGTFVAISDHYGLIEVALHMAEANERIGAVAKRAGLTWAA